MSSKQHRLMVLWAEVMPYNVACFRDFAASGGEVDVYCWDSSKKLTPYKAPSMYGVHYVEESSVSASDIIGRLHSHKPDLVIVVGRMESKYLKVASAARKMGIPVAGCADNQFRGDLRQMVAKWLGGLLYRRYFDFMLVPGLYQYEYMRYLGFARDKIKVPQYCADTDLFEKAYRSRGKNFSARSTILFTGRLHPVKGIDVLLDAYTELQNDGFDGKLIVVGGGEFCRDRLSHHGIQWHGFLAQSDILELLPTVRMFCLPSREEPWGLVVHEFAAAGLPIVATKACGAATAFVRERYNGFLTEPGDKSTLKDAIRKLYSLSEEEWYQYSDRSYELSRQITPALWTSTVKSMMKC